MIQIWGWNKRAKCAPFCNWVITRGECSMAWLSESTQICVILEPGGDSWSVDLLIPLKTLHRIIQSWCPFNGWTRTLVDFFKGKIMLGKWPDDCMTGGKWKNIYSESPYLGEVQWKSEFKFYFLPPVQHSSVHEPSIDIPKNKRTTAVSLLVH